MIFAIGMTSLLWGLSASRKNKPVSLWRHLIFGGLVLFFVATLVQTGTRGAYLGFVVGLTLLALLSAIFLRQTNRRLVLVAGGLAIVTLLGVGSIFVFKESNFVKNNDILNHIAVLSEFGDVGSVRERYVNWQVALEAFRDKPVFGWGPENYDIAFNAHYNYLAGKDEPWFDSSHSQLFDTLAETGIFGFSLYLFWVGAVFYAAAGLLKRGPGDKLIGVILASTYLGFLVQGWFLFDTFPMYLGLFPLLGFAYFKYEDASTDADRKTVANQGSLSRRRFYILAVLFLLLIPFLIFKNVWQPYLANTLIFEYQRYLNGGRYREAAAFFKKAMKIDSPYTNFDVGNQSSWNLLYVLDALGNPMPEQSRSDVHEIYKLVTVREEKSREYRPLDHQVYYVLGRLYRYGYQDFGIPEYLTKSEAFLKQGRAISPKRVEYVNELADTLLLQGKREEAENLVKEHAASIGPPYSYKFVGNLYFVLGNYDLALAEFKKAEAAGFAFWENEVEYNRYVFVSQQTGDYEAVLKLSKNYIAKKGPSAVAFFNQAVAYYYLGNKDEARKSYSKAANLDRSYKQYASFFAAP